MGRLTTAEAAAGRKLTPQEIWKIGYRFMREQGLGGLPILPY
jgi:hypothetical protein